MFCTFAIGSMYIISFQNPICHESIGYVRGNEQVAGIGCLSELLSLSVKSHDRYGTYWICLVHILICI